MQGWHPAVISRTTEVGDQLVQVTLEVPHAVASSFHTPGQYHRLRVDGGSPAFYAIASAPGGASFEYLVKRGSAVANAWLAKPLGAHVEVGVAEGPGFPLRLARGRNLVMIATGTGFAPVRSVLKAIEAERDAFGYVGVLYGVRTPSHLAFGAELAAWHAQRLDVHATVTQPTPEWTGLVGRVQAALPHLQVHDAVAFLCGQREMVAEVTVALERRGIPPERVFLNFSNG